MAACQQERALDDAGEGVQIIITMQYSNPKLKCNTCHPLENSMVATSMNIRLCVQAWAITEMIQE